MALDTTGNMNMIEIDNYRWKIIPQFLWCKIKLHKIIKKIKWIW